jgi:hypothetical protein
MMINTTTGLDKVSISPDVDAMGDPSDVCDLCCRSRSPMWFCRHAVVPPICASKVDAHMLRSMQSDVIAQDLRSPCCIW